MRHYILTVCTIDYQVVDDGTGGSTDRELDRYRGLVHRRHLIDVATYLADHGLVVPSHYPEPGQDTWLHTVPQPEGDHWVMLTAHPDPATFTGREWCAVVTAVTTRAESRDV
ncbi:hypothetical protein [Amycolatopsis anabasis]|uniref:hypothetical protein n=1 Tax=Amycolatopsis anabasis TaxID=1840409 RepID=UPI00131A85CF|nr:hypothetical protein [Amycolatopsis anabasis]